MVKLIALTSGEGLLPISEGGVAVTEVILNQLVSVAPFAGKHKATSDALKTQCGAGLPAVNRRRGAVTWFGHGTWMVAGDAALDGLAAVTDQSDAWAVVSISGAGVEDVLARLVPVDLLPPVFKTNHVAKTMLGHMSVTITRTAPAEFEIIAMRSMATSMVHELQVAMRGAASRA